MTDEEWLSRKVPVNREWYAMKNPGGYSWLVVRNNERPLFTGDVEPYIKPRGVRPSKFKSHDAATAFANTLNGTGP